MGLAVLLHVPLAPLVDLSRVAQFFRRQPSAVRLVPIAEVPVDLVDAPAGPEATPTAAETPPQSSGSPTSALVGDAAGDTAVVAAPAPANKRRRARQRRPALVTAAVAKPVLPRAEHSQASDSIPDPTAALGELKLPARQSSLRLLLHVDRLRGSALASQLGSLLGGVEQWRGLFQDGALNPTRDIDRLLLLGPGVRDSRSFVGVFAYNVPRFQVRQAVTSNGGRVCAFPSPDTLVIGPPNAQASLKNIPRAFRLPGPAGAELLVLHVDKPAQALHGLPLVVPSSLRWARLQVTVNREGDAQVALLARDSSPAAAEQSALSLTSALGTRVIAQGDHVQATLQLTPEALQSVLQSGLAALGSSPTLAGADGALPAAAHQADPQQQARQQ